MLVGINYPWIDYGWDFGDPPKAWVDDESLPAWRERKRRRIQDDFRLFASQGIFAVRWFLLGDGLNYGTDELAPRETVNRWAFDPLPAVHPFYGSLRDDFEFVLQVCRTSGLQLLPSLIDFHWCRQGAPVAGNTGIVKGGRRDVILDPEKRRVFFDRVLDPLLRSSLQYPDSIFAWEVINEPEWIVRKTSLYGQGEGRQDVSQIRMREFIAEGIRRINAQPLPDGNSAFRSSVGFAHWESLDQWDAEELGITLHQFHYYAQQNCDLPRHSHLKNQACVVGEFATAAGPDWPDLKLLNKDQTITNRLCCIEDKGYPACFMWSANAIDPATRWTEETHRELIAYNDLSRPDSLSG
jgi:hypothetical protein